MVKTAWRYIEMAQSSIRNFFTSAGEKRKAQDNSEDAPSAKEAKLSEGANKPGKTLRSKSFQNGWYDEFQWLRREAKGPMFCTICESASGSRKSLKSNAFVKGTLNFQRSALSRHMDSDDHLLAKKTITQQRYMAAAKKCATKSVMPILEAQIRTAAFLAQENLSNRKFLKLIDLQLANGASVFLDKKGIYTNHQAPAIMQKYVANVLKDTAVVRIRDSPYLGIMVDESLNIATPKKLVMYFLLH